MKEGQKAIYYLAGGNEKLLKASPIVQAFKSKGYEVLILDEDIDELVISTVYEYDKVPLKAINRSDALDEIATDEEKKANEEKSPLADRIASALGDRVKKVIVSSRLGDAPSSVIIDENDPSMEMQRLMKQMGGPVDDVKPILEINPSSSLVKKIEESTDDESVKNLSIVLLGQALIQEGILPKDPNEFASALTKAFN